MPGDFDQTQVTPDVIDLTDAPDAPDESEEPGTSTRERIIDAAAEVFLEKGFTGTRVVDIARRAGYTSGALYGYFDSRAELLAEAVARSSSEMLSHLLGTNSDGSNPDVANSGGTASAGDTNGGEGPAPKRTTDPLSVLAVALDQIAEPLNESDQMLLDGVALAHREPVAGDRLAEALGQFRSQLTGVDGEDLAPGAADLLVVLVLGITSARALGLHEPPPEELRLHLAECLKAAKA